MSRASGASRRLLFVGIHAQTPLVINGQMTRRRPINLPVLRSTRTTLHLDHSCKTMNTVCFKGTAPYPNSVNPVPVAKARTVVNNGPRNASLCDSTSERNSGVL